MNEVMAGTTADTWAEEAALLPLAFSQVREDPRLDVELAKALGPGANVVMIASGGETAVRLGQLPLGQLHLVDMNAAQLSLTRVKWHLAETARPDEVAELLGHSPLSLAARRDRLRGVFSSLGFAEDVFGPLDFVAWHGPDHVGRYERTFSELRAALAPWQSALNEWLASRDPEGAGRMIVPDTDFGAALDAAFARVMSLPNLVRLFGEAATQNPRREFHSHFAWRTRVVTGRIPPLSNPFLWQIFGGRFAEGCRYDWLQDVEIFGSPMQVAPEFHHGRMDDVLGVMPEQSMDLIHLSNILDWLTPAEAAATLRHAWRVLRPGGRVILRQLNSTLDVDRLDSGLGWDHELGDAMEAQDRSFFYPRIFVGMRA